MTQNLPAWRKELQPASFRGKPFSVKRADSQVGRRTVVHTYPQRDKAFTEDMGAVARAFTVEAIVIGPDYMKARDALIEALNQPGPGQLVHPYYGRVMVALTSPARISESYEFGGSARFSLDFVEDDGENVQPSARADTPSLVEASADNAFEAIAEDFADSFSLDGLPDFVEMGALDIANDIMGALDSLRGGLVPDLSILSEYLDAANGVTGSLGSLLRMPADFASRMLGLFSGVSGLASSPLAALAAYRGLFGYGLSSRSSRSAASAPAYTRYGNALPPVPLVTPARIAQAQNQEALAALTRRAALVEAARQSSRIEYESANQAASVRNELAERLDDEAAGLTLGEGASMPSGMGGQPGAAIVPDPVYNALTELRAAVVRDITTRGADLARVSSVELPATLPALVAAYKVYGDATRADELVSRNRSLIRHPGFVPGGQSLEILVK